MSIEITTTSPQILSAIRFSLGNSFNSIPSTSSIQPFVGNNIASGNYSAILGGQNNNTNGVQNTFILGSNITASLPNHAYVNNLSSIGTIKASGGNSDNWNTAYETIEGNYSVFPAVQSLSGDWNSSYSTVNRLSGTWNATSVTTSALNLSAPTWNDVSSLTVRNSALWGTGGTLITFGEIPALSGGWNASTSAINLSSELWNGAYTWVNSNSANSSFTTVYAENRISSPYAEIVDIVAVNSISSVAISGTFYGDGSSLLLNQQLGVNTWVQSNSSDAMFNSVSAISLTAETIYGRNNETVFTDGSNDAGSGPGTLALNYTNGVYVNSPSLTINGNSYFTGNIFYAGRNGDNWNSSYSTVNSNSADWNSAYKVATTYQNASGSFATYSYLHNGFLPLSGGTISGAARINNNLTVYGVISATGNAYFANTVYSTTSALSVVNIGNTGPALYVGNNGTGDIASFYDLDANVEVLHVGGDNGSFPNVGVKTSSPNVDFTVNGQISANNVIWSANGDSNNWNSAYTTVQNNSATTWNYQGSDLKALSGNWQNTFTVVNSNSGNWNDAYTNLVSNSANYLSATDLSFLSVSGNWNDAYTNLVSNSANWQSTFVTMSSLSADWQNSYTNVNSNSANWNNAFNTATTYQNASAAFATNVYVNASFLPLTGGIVSGATRINNNLTVFGDLTATGKTTFANTVFSVTSALSVVHVGSGPAMWIGNNGDGDIASFYDIDANIEILHVGGNNGSFPNVGVKTSTPNVDFTVNGQISANNTIWSAGGNSDNWNNAFTIVRSSSADAINVNTVVRSNSATWIVDGGNTKASNLLIGTNDAFDVNLESNGIVRMSVLSSGNIGIGTTTPNQNLTVIGIISASNSVSAPTVTANNIIGQGNETVFTDGSNLIGNGANTISLNYTNGAFINSNVSVNGWVTGRARINTQTGTTYTILSSDAGSIINATSNTGLTASVVGTNYPAGFQTTILQAGTAQVRLSGGPGITINQANNFLRTSKQWSAATLVFTGTSWVLFGDVSA